MLKPKNIIIFIVAALILTLVYIFFLKPSPEPDGLVTVPANPATSSSGVSSSPNALDTNDFLNVLLNVKNIKLDDTIFSSPAFNTLRDSSIVLTPDGTEGRADPFAPIGYDRVLPPTTTNTTTTNTTNTNNANTTSPPSTTTTPTN